MLICKPQSKSHNRASTPQASRLKVPSSGKISRRKVVLKANTRSRSDRWLPRTLTTPLNSLLKAWSNLCRLGSSTECLLKRIARRLTHLCQHINLMYCLIIVARRASSKMKLSCQGKVSALFRKTSANQSITCLATCQPPKFLNQSPTANNPRPHLPATLNPPRPSP